jgi:predicted metalloprotease with PDZ domain
VDAGRRLRPIQLTYIVDAAFARSKWPYGNEQAGFFDGKALYIVSKALFVATSDITQAAVSFEVPAGWRISTPWRRDASGSYHVGSRDELFDNSLVLGDYAEHVFSEGQLRVVVAMLGRAREAHALVGKALRENVRSFTAIFPRTPPSAFLITLFYGEEADAEAFRNSAAFTEHDALAGENLVRWGNTVAHELFHTWNGHAIQAEDYASTQWFSEGFTDYFATQALLEGRLITPDLFREKMEKILGLYFYFRVAPAFEGISLRQAGEKKGLHRLGVYDGGWAVAFCLDQLIRERTRGTRSLATFMNLMYERFGLTGRKYSFDDLVAVASETGGTDLRDFFARYVSGTEMLPVKESLALAGYRAYTQYYDGELYIVPKSR